MIIHKTDLRKICFFVIMLSMNTTLKIQSRGTITLPKKIRESLSLKVGDFLSVNLKDRKITVEPVKKDEDLQKDILSSLQDIKNGNFITFSSSKEMRAKLK
ncbi:AbrB/MazE/SpoVT family DNA-binding domain-containing protein [Patescibacteria group bacterium]|nr:AbrB/MazE/SpoVT family DNA-binding domain-containing protein [Patescibacteria group bacterium]MCG2694801.1 AbrB/MazE/SpoVT family DNA-binding domain-containing protein [Candidatus Parcubacteria bacterium]